MKIGRLVAGGVGLVLVLVLGGVYYLSISLDEIVRSAIEDYGSEITGTDVRVSSVRIEVREGKGTIRGLRVANPAGFPAGDSVSLGEISVGIDPGSLSSQDPIVITFIDVTEPSVSLVTDASGATNLGAIQANIERYSGESEPAPENADGAPTLLSIRKLAVEGGRLAADLTAVGGKRMEATLPPLRLSKLGGSKGSTPGEIGASVAEAFFKSCLAAVAESQINEQLGGLLDEKLGAPAGAAGRELLKGLFKK